MHQDRTTRRRAMLAGGVALTATAAAVVPASPAAAGGDADDAAAIRQLSTNYAIGTDAVPRGDLATARARYAATFAPDATIAAGFDRATPALTATGPEAWLQVVVGAFQPYTATQHLLGTVDVAIRRERGRRRATMSTYLHATHVLAATPELRKVLGTYHDEVEHGRDGWRIVNRFLQFTSFETVPRTLP